MKAFAALVETGQASGLDVDDVADAGMPVPVCERLGATAHSSIDRAAM